MDEYLICEGCHEKIFVGDEVLELKLCECEDSEIYTIHRRMECLLKVDGVSEGTITNIRTISPEELREQEKGIHRVK